MLASFLVRILIYRYKRIYMEKTNYLSIGSVKEYVFRNLLPGSQKDTSKDSSSNYQPFCLSNLAEGHFHPWKILYNLGENPYAPRIWHKTTQLLAPLTRSVLCGDSQRGVMVVLVFLTSEHSSKHKCRRQGAGVGITFPNAGKIWEICHHRQKSALSQAKSFEQWILY